MLEISLLRSVYLCKAQAKPLDSESNDTTGFFDWCFQAKQESSLQSQSLLDLTNSDPESTSELAPKWPANAPSDFPFAANQSFELRDTALARAPVSNSDNPSESI